MATIHAKLFFICYAEKMFVRKRRMADPSKFKVQICESVRNGNKVSQKVVRYIGVATTPEELEALNRIALCAIEDINNERNGGSLFDSQELLSKVDTDAPVTENDTEIKKVKAPKTVNIADLKEEARYEEGPIDIFGFAAESNGLLECVEESDRELLKQLIAQRIAVPASKRKTHENLLNKVGFQCSLNDIYRFLSRLGKKEELINATCFNLRNSIFNNEIDVLFFDVTTLYFESWTQDELRDFGFSKDCKFGQVQVTLALATDKDGFPIGYKLFSGNTAEISTLVECIQEWRKTIPIRDTIFVADRGMLSTKNLWELEQSGFKYIVGFPLRKLPKSSAEEVLSENGYSAGTINVEGKTELHWIKNFGHQLSFRKKNESGTYDTHIVKGRLIAGYSSKRAAKDKSDREKMLDKAIKKYSSKKKSKASVAELKQLVGNRGYSKFLKIQQAEKVTVGIDEDKVAQDAQWDGMHGVFTNTNLSSSEALARYRGLWKIEDCFRLQKTNLKIRPIFHFSPQRVRGHIALCFLSLVTLKTVEKKLKDFGINLSPARIAEEASNVESSIVHDKKKGIRFRLPSKLSELAQKIYDCLGLKRSSKPQIL